MQPASPEAASSPASPTQEEKESEDETNDESDFEWEHKDAFSLVVEEVTMIDSLAGTLTSVKKQPVGNCQAQAASSQMMSAEKLLAFTRY